MPNPTRSEELALLPGLPFALLLVRVDGRCSAMAVPAGRLLDGLQAACALMSFSALHQDDQPLDELLPWAGSV